MKESTIEKHLVKRVKAIGGKAVKMVPTFENGIPDRQVLYKGRAIFVEVKKPGETPRRLQVEYMRELAAAGFECRVIDSIDGVEKLIFDLTNG